MTQPIVRTNVTLLWGSLILIMIIALVARLLLLASNSVSFHSDEAVVGLMARHILNGERPTFFYGQAYMGTLDAWWVAAGFRLLGESVQTIRIMQSLLYLMVVATSFYAAWVLSRRVLVAFVCASTFALPPVMLALYTTATLGGYNETLILGHLTIAVGFSAAHAERTSWLRWLALGFFIGLGWWANALIAVYAIPIVVYVLSRSVRGHIPRARLLLPIAFIGLLMGSLPWWSYALQHDLTPIRFFLPDVLGERDVVGAVIPSVPFVERLLGLFVFGLPTVIGLRFPWSGDYYAPALGLAVLIIHLLALYRIARNVASPGRDLRTSLLAPHIGWIMFSIIGVLCLLFLATRFSSDPSGRYFLPLSFPFGLALGALIASISRRLWAAGLLIAVLGYYAAGQLSAAQIPPGITTQFVAQTHLPNDDDQALIDWLAANDIRHGYTSYWISFRIAYLSGEQVQLSAALPDKSDLSYTPAFERYPPYRAATDSANRIAYITANVPELDAALVAWFSDTGITFEQQTVGIFRVYYGFAPTIPRPPFPFLLP